MSSTELLTSLDMVYSELMDKLPHHLTYFDDLGHLRVSESESHLVLKLTKFAKSVLALGVHSENNLFE
jgi:hypothetical protein